MPVTPEELRRAVFEHLALAGDPRAADLLKAAAVPALAGAYPARGKREKIERPKPGDWSHDVTKLSPQAHAVHQAFHEDEFRQLLAEYLAATDPAEKETLIRSIRELCVHWAQHRLLRHAPQVARPGAQRDAQRDVKPDTARKLAKSMEEPAGRVEQYLRDLKRRPLPLVDPESRKAHPWFLWRGLPIRIETNAGEVRRGKDWESTQRYAYGEIPTVLGVDGDPLDCYVGSNLDAPTVYVVHIHDLGKVKDWPAGACPKCGGQPSACWDDLDEDKCGIGFGSRAEFENVIRLHYDTEAFLGPVSEFPADEFALLCQMGMRPIQPPRKVGRSAAVEPIVQKAAARLTVKAEPKRDPSYDPKHPEECCPHCGACQEQDTYAEKCNRCGRPWPVEKGVHNRGTSPNPEGVLLTVPDGRLAKAAAPFPAGPVEKAGFSLGTHATPGHPALSPPLPPRPAILTADRRPTPDGDRPWAREARDEQGRWTDSGRGAAETRTAPSVLPWQKTSEVTWEATDPAGEKWTIRRNSKTGQHSLYREGRLQAIFPDRASATLHVDRLVRPPAAAPPVAPVPPTPPAPVPTTPAGQPLQWVRPKETVWEARDAQGQKWQIRRNTRTRQFHLYRDGNEEGRGYPTRQQAMAAATAAGVSGASATPSPTPAALPASIPSISPVPPPRPADYGFPASYPPQASAGAAEAWAARHFPHAVWDFTGMDTEGANATVGELTRLANQYPQVMREAITYVGTFQDPAKQPPSVRGTPGPFRWKKGNWANYHYGHRSIGLNPAAYGNHRRFKRELQECVRIGWHPPGCDTAESMVCHEFGHAVDAWLLNQGHRTPLPVADSGLRSVAAVQKEVFGARQDQPAPPRGFGTVSNYATTKPTETWAEAFAELHYGTRKPPPILTQQEGRWLSQVFERGTYDRRHAARYDRLDAAGQQAAQALIVQGRHELGL